jgi:hypothetical protein
MATFDRVRDYISPAQKEEKENVMSSTKDYHRENFRRAKVKASSFG